MKRLSHPYPPEIRLRKRADYLYCYEHGARFHTRHFMLYVWQSPNLLPRFGIAVSKKVGNAVARNRVKRVLREVFRLSPCPAPGLLLVAVAKKNATAINFWDAQAELAPFIAQGTQRRSR